MRARKTPVLKDTTFLVLIGLFALAAPGAADLICPLCESPGPAPLSVAGVVDLVLSSLIEKGIAVLFMGAMAIVGLPWAIAASALGLLHLPKRLGQTGQKARPAAEKSLR